jgi:cell filamentation protein, protein adenylyltransferase
VTFDPFGDFETRGYLRNVARAKDPRIIRQLEHSSFTTGLDTAFAKLTARQKKTLPRRVRCTNNRLPGF